ncbi:MAG: efflux RND transporter periplasmic adaptor subunit [Pseudomonadota bacterium]
MAEPKPRFPINSSIVWAVVIAVVVAGWMGSGLLKNDEAAAVTAQRSGSGGSEGEPASDEPSQPLFRVRAEAFKAQDRASTLEVRGRTEALRKVEVRSETVGTVVGLPVEKGSLVKAGDVLCELSVDTREADLSDAQALVKQRKLEWDAARRLAKQGHTSETQAAAAEAQYQAGLARVKMMEIALERTKIRAPFDGIMDDRHVEIGDYMRAADACALVVDQDPFLVVAQLAEQEVGRVEAGAKASAKLITGETVEGKVRFVARTADETTRTFRVELSVEGSEMTFRDGVTATLKIPTQTVSAHLLPAAILSLDERGRIGVRTVDATDTVRFKPVTLIDDGGEGVWATGLADLETVITVGQDFVVDGQKVDVQRGPAPESQTVSQSDNSDTPDNQTE